MTNASVLVAGGAGYIGSHMCKLLYQNGFTPIVIDNLSYGHKEFVKWGPLIIGDIANKELVQKTIQTYQPIAAFHFSAFTYVGESVQNPQKYYQNNVVQTIHFLDSLIEMNVKHVIFSSSCATYGIPQEKYLTESHPQNPINPYGMTKLIIEKCLQDYSKAYGLKSVSLRYFNAAGADPDHEIGEDHNPETHLIPLVLDVALKRKKSITIFGDNYPTKDGTCIRDYIHINDLGLAHLQALKYLQNQGETTAFNLGNGQGFSVKEIIAKTIKITNKPIPIEIGPKREGDPPILVGNASKAHSVLKWTPQYANIQTIIKTAWAWHQRRFG